MPGVTTLVPEWSLRKAGDHFLPDKILFRNLPVSRHFRWAATGMLNTCSTGEGAQLPSWQNYFCLLQTPLTVVSGIFMIAPSPCSL